MRIVVSGTHGSGKSTLIADFARRHPEYDVLPDPFEFIDDEADTPSARLFATQLRISAQRLSDEHHGSALIAERGPIDFLAYLLAHAAMTGTSIDPTSWERALAVTRDALSTVDALVMLPLTSSDPIPVPDDEHPQLRQSMNDALLDCVDDPDITGGSLRVIELTGSPGDRLAALEIALFGADTHPR